MESGHHAIVNATNPTLRGGDGADVARDAQRAPDGAGRRPSVLPGARAQLRPRAIATTVEVALAADFADVFEVRGVARRTRGRVLPPEREADRVRLAYAGEDGERRETLIELALHLCGSRSTTRARTSRGTSPSSGARPRRCRSPSIPRNETPLPRRRRLRLPPHACGRLTRTGSARALASRPTTSSSTGSSTRRSGDLTP